LSILPLRGCESASDEGSGVRLICNWLRLTAVAFGVLNIDPSRLASGFSHRDFGR